MNTIINEIGIGYVLGSDGIYYPAFLFRGKFTKHLSQFDDATGEIMLYQSSKSLP